MVAVGTAAAGGARANVFKLSMRGVVVATLDTNSTRPLENRHVLVLIPVNGLNCHNRLGPVSDLSNIMRSIPLRGHTQSLVEV